MLRIAVAASLLSLLCACSKPEPPPTEHKPDPQATALRDTINAPLDKAKAVQGTVDAAADKQRAAIDATN